MFPDQNTLEDRIIVTEKNITAWSLIRPFWVSEQKWSARGLLALVVAMNMAIVYINVRLNSWNVAFYDSLQKRDVVAFRHALVEFAFIVFPYVLIAIYRIYFRQMLEFRWRQWLTNNYVHRWLKDHAFYRIERDHLADNPDQRISDDLQGLASTTLALSLDLLSTLVTLFSFITILWTVAGALSITLFHVPLRIPGYMVWVALVYAIIGSVVMFKVGRPLVTINYQQQRVEADFRFMLIRLRESAEQVALYDGAATETRRVGDAFERIRDNWRMVMRLTKRLTLVNSVYGQVAIIFPLIAAGPQYFAGAFSLGVLMQINSAFGQVSDAMSWFIGSFSTLANWRATVNRLREFRRSIDQQHFAETESPATLAGGINLHRTAGRTVETHALALARPNGAALTTIADVVAVPGSRWLVRGPSGSGKSTLLRALAGLWAFGSGTIDIPAGARLLFVPQQSYMPIDTLKANLCYPSDAAAFTDAQCQEVLIACQLADFSERLTESTHWARLMSPGEQQRVAFARVLLQKPDIVCLDEATSALDTATEAVLYRLLIERLPDTTVVSVGHRDTLDAFHPEHLDLA
ncbi:MAG: ABC transporter ATP-binding protein/permease [Janthinobacterium lividum]